jgi:hypothetical protein
MAWPTAGAPANHDWEARMSLDYTNHRRCAAATIVQTALAVAVLAGSGNAGASGIPFAGNRPQSFEFPIDYTESYNSFGQFVQYNEDNRHFDNTGDKVPGSGHTFVGLSSALHYWKFDALPSVGWVGSVTVPEVRVEGRGFAASGVGDPLVGGLAFIKPTPSSTLGVQALVQVPIGASSVTTNTWSLWPSVFYNVWFENRFNLDVLVGGVLRSTTHKTGTNDLDAGNTWHANVRFGSALEPVLYTKPVYVMPFVGIDFQHTGKTRDRFSGMTLADSDSRETAANLGVLFQLQRRKSYDQFEMHYARGLNGRNTSVTNGLFLQYWHYY